jgi:hypothetical protein
MVAVENMFLRLCRAVALLAVVSSALRAQDVAPPADSLWLRGVVTDTTGVPIRNAVVLVEPQGASTRTDSLGRFSLRVAPGPAELIVRSIGFGALREEMTLAGPGEVRFEVELPSVAVVLDAFRVESRTAYLPPGAPAYLSEFYRRRAQGLGRYFTAEEIARYGGLNGAISGIPGVRLYYDSAQQIQGVVMTRCPSGQIAWFVDGNLVVGAPQFSEFEVLAVEIYRGPSLMPPEAIGDACGAVFVWLRRH